MKISHILLTLIISLFIQQFASAEMSLKELTQKCNRGDMNSCLQAGDRLLDTKDKNQARELFDRACKGGLILACTYWGLTYSEGSQKQREIFLAACDKNSYTACTELANIEWRRGNHDSAKPFYKKSCELGSSLSCASYREYLLKEMLSEKPSKEELKRVYSKLCDTYNWDSESCEFAGILEKEIGELSKALEFLEKACKMKQSRGDGCFYLGEAYAENKDSKKAAKYYGEGCTRGNPNACIFQAYHEKILGNEKETIRLAKVACEENSDYRGCVLLSNWASDEVDKTFWYVKACDRLGGQIYCESLGHTYEKASNYVKAREYYEKACDKKTPTACYAYAKLEQKLSNNEKAKELYKKSCNQGYNDACKELVDKRNR